MPNLKKVQFYQSNNLTNIECLANSKKLEYLSLIFVSASVQNLNLPKLTYLNIKMENKPKFRNN